MLQNERFWTIPTNLQRIGRSAKFDLPLTPRMDYSVTQHYYLGIFTNDGAPNPCWESA